MMFVRATTISRLIGLITKRWQTSNPSGYTFIKDQINHQLHQYLLRYQRSILSGFVFGSDVEFLRKKTSRTFKDRSSCCTFTASGDRKAAPASWITSSIKLNAAQTATRRAKTLVGWRWSRSPEGIQHGPSRLRMKQRELFLPAFGDRACPSHWRVQSERNGPGVLTHSGMRLPGDLGDPAIHCRRSVESR